ncbi:MAG TPA: SMP-30/gluconolactonase/LRE family protein, partial [Prosthecobacter sp.]
ASSGGIAAFNVAWQRPDAFRRVYSMIGTFIGLRGADEFPVLIRKTEPKPIRVFLQSGTGDNNLYCGDWWMANQMMERSLTWAGYEVNHAWGEGGHNGKHATQIFPDVLRWLWKDWQTNMEVKANAKGESKWKGYEIFATGEGWKAGDPEHSFQKFDPVQKEAKAARAKALALDVKIAAVKGPVGVESTLSPDQTLIYISGMREPQMVESSQFGADNALRHSQPYYRLDLDYDGACEVGGMCVDIEGRLYVATSLGVQVCDQAGRVNFIIPTPSTPRDVCFGGKDLNELFIQLGSSGYLVRQTKVKGVIKGQPPIKPAAPKL